MERKQKIALRPTRRVSLPPVAATGSPTDVAEVTVQLAEMPAGSWYLRATTDSPAELAAQTAELDPETLKVRASFQNFLDFPVTITGFVVDEE